jgi:hypothetical protein
MTTTQTHSRPPLLTASTNVILAVLGLIDIALIGAVWTDDPPPLGVSLGVGALGVITLVGLMPANRGSRPALGMVVVSRAVSALLAVPAFFLDAPAWVLVVEGFVIVATVYALVMVRRSVARPA